LNEVFESTPGHPREIFKTNKDLFVGCGQRNLKRVRKRKPRKKKEGGDGGLHQLVV